MIQIRQQELVFKHLLAHHWVHPSQAHAIGAPCSPRWVGFNQL